MYVFALAVKLVIEINGTRSVLMVHVATAGAKMPSVTGGETIVEFVSVKMTIYVGKFEIVGAFERIMVMVSCLRVDFTELLSSKDCRMRV